MLHENKELFEQAVLRTSEAFGIEAGIVEKDYFVTLFLKEISKEAVPTVFKGGTSLSKCHKLIKRFSEDIDLNIKCEIKPTQGQRKGLKSEICDIIERLGLTLTNPEDIYSNREYNKYVVDFPSVFTSETLKPHLLVETVVYIRAYPTEVMEAASMIYDYFKQNGLDALIAEHGLEPFELNVQTAARTFVDKVYAIGDYYLDGRIREHSRHIYDLYKLLEVVSLDDGLKELIASVREDRKAHKTCLSVQDGVDMQDILDRIIKENTYKDDYKDITETLLFEELPYETAISAIVKIRDSGLF